MTSSRQRFALVDCNNFYASCERLFRPDLLNKPIVVLSNNDGCVVARSAEAKALGIKMAAPVHQIKELLDYHQVVKFSSNYTLYADLSARVMAVLAEFSPCREIYSIDEAFLDLSGICDENPVAYGKKIRWTIQHHIGIPVCVGMGPTKTLAKLANYAAKRWKQTGGVVDLACPDQRKRLMQKVPVREIWGIGSRLAEKLNRLGVTSAWELNCLPPATIHQLFNVSVARTVKELNGISCLPLEEHPPNRQQIICSRSFKQRLTSFDELAQALNQYASRVAEKLRQQNSLAGSVSISIRTGLFDRSRKQYQRSIGLSLSATTQDSRLIIKTAKQLLKQIYRPGFDYQHAGVMLGQIVPVNHCRQIELFAVQNKQRLMQTVDEINRRFPHKLSVSGAEIRQQWSYQPKNLSKRYTTHWQELASVRCS